MKAMIRLREYFNDRNKGLKDKDQSYMILTVHDELLFDYPEGKGKKEIEEVARIMRKGGDDIGIPTPVGISYHPRTWSEEIDYEDTK